MTAKQLSYSLLRTISVLIFTAVLLYFLWEIRSIFAYFAIAFAIAMIGRPLMNLMHDKLRIPNSLASVITIITFIGLLAGFITLFISLVLNQPFNFIQNLNSLDDFDKAINEQLKFLNESLDALKIPLIGDYLTETLKGIDAKSISGVFSESLSSLGAILLDVFSICFITFFFLKDRDLINRMIVAIAPQKEESRFEKVLNTIKDLLSRYFIGLTLQVIIMFTFYLIILLSFGVNYAAVIALLCAFLNLIPYLGPVIGGIIMASLSMSDMYSNGLDLHNQIIPNTLWITALYLIAQAWDNFINQPLIYSRSVKSNPLEIFIVILIGGILFGVIGVIIAVPSYTVIRVLLKEFFSEYKIVQSLTKNL